MNRILLLFLFSLITTSLFAQWYDPEKVSKKVQVINERAYQFAIDGKYPEAISSLNEALTLDPRFVDGYLSRAGIHANLKDYKSSVADYTRGFSLDSIYASTFLLPYSISLAGTGNFEGALKAVNAFLLNPRLNEQSRNAGNYRKSTYEFAIEHSRKYPVNSYTFVPKNMTESINSVHLEYFPSLTIDGKTMIFTRRMNQDEDFYESTFINGNWSKAKPLGGMINTNLNEGAQNISQDGNWLIFTGCNYPEGEGSCDLYIAYRTRNGDWTEPQNMGPVINTDFWESSPSLSPDKRDLYFTSSMPGGYGGKDIWVSRRLPDGKWSRPRNLGPTINTSGDEASPFIHPDNQTLYFNSNGHPGYGTTDLFLSRKQGDTAWSTPFNLGYPINTIDDEGSLIVAADGKTGYYASDGGPTLGGLDLYTFELPENARALQTTWVRGQVFDRKTREGLPSLIELTELDTRITISRLQTDEDGNYLVTLPAGKQYAFNVNRKGYLFHSENFDIDKNISDSFLVVDIPLQPIEKGASIVLKNIFFDNNEFELKPESMTELEKVVALLKDNPALTISIEGHTDNVGSDADNLKLSVNRAKAVVGFLVNQGIDPKRLTHKGYGATMPIAPNSTQEGKALNRRTEMKVTSQ